ncbi:MAG: excinuclease ABC subunit UvrC [Planctomycetota bacterium]|nr:MAG: excinuclease ABC subunit UvrC [Planctomycetota bacterium]
MERTMGTRSKQAKEAGPADPAIERKLAELPQAPGVYLLLGARHRPVYIGKASNLRTRVRSYFRVADDGRLLYPFLVREVRDLEWIVTETEQEALLLEDTLLKQHKPRFNIKLRDDKTYLSIQVTMRERFPRALLVRRPRKDGSLYFGPYSSASAIRTTLDVVRKHFGLRTCSNAEFRQRTRPCIQHQMGRCGAPCVGLQTERDYRRGVEDALQFLRGRTAPLLERLRARMEQHAERLEFEAAAKLRDQIAAIERATEAQRVVRHGGGDRDVFGEVREGELLRVQVLHFREGRLTGTGGWTLATPLPTAEALDELLRRFYSAERFLPAEIVFPLALEDAEIYERWLSERRGRRVRIVTPVRGERRRLIELARHNAREALRLAEERERLRRDALEALAHALGLAAAPQRIACLDISNTGNALAVGSVVTMRDGELEPSGYRRFQVRDLALRGDTERMAEVAERYLRRCLPRDGRRAREPLPDLLVVDGGKGQLGALVGVLERLGLESRLPVCAIAKSHDERGRALRAAGRTEPERLFVPGRAEPLRLPAGSPAMHLVQRLRDEAHRFAIGYHRKLRRKRTLRAGIEEVPGIGPRRRKALFEHFGTLRRLREASVDEIAACPGITRAQAEAVHAFLSEAELPED